MNIMKLQKCEHRQLALTNRSAISPLPYVHVRQRALEVWKAAYGTDTLAIPLPEFRRIFSSSPTTAFLTAGASVVAPWREPFSSFGGLVGPLRGIQTVRETLLAS